MPNEYDLLQFFSQQTRPVNLRELFTYFSHDSFMLTPLYELVKSGYIEELETDSGKQYQVTEKGKTEQQTRDHMRT